MGFLERLREHKARGKTTPLMIDVQKVGSSRAIYMGKHQPAMVHFQLETSDGDILLLELTATQTAEAIEALTHSYYAINPVLKIRREGGF